MAETSQRSVSVRRVSPRRYIATNPRGGELTFGEGEDADFSPIELLLAAVAGCSAIDVDYIVSRRSEPESLEIESSATKVRDESGNHLEDIELVFRARFPAGESADSARAVLPDAVAKSHDRLCTVSRTIEDGTPVTVRVE